MFQVIISPCSILQISVMFVATSLGVLIGIFIDTNVLVGIATATAVALVCDLLCGYFVPLKIQDQIVQDLSYLSIIKVSFQSSLVIIYGLDRCEGTTPSFVLKEMNLDDDSLIVNAWWILGN